MAAYEETDLEKTLEKKARKKFNFEIEEDWSEEAKKATTKVDLLVHAAHGNGSAFIEVLLGDDHQLLVTYNYNKLPDEDEEEKKDKEEEKEDKTGDKILVKVYKSKKSDAIFAISDKELSERQSHAVMKKLLAWVQPSQIMLFDSMSKTAYASFDFISDANILKYMVTSKCKVDVKELEAEPVEVTNGVSGLNGSLLVHSEIHKIPCILFMSILDSYDLTIETFSSYEKVLKVSKALSAHAKDIDSLPKRKNYKEILKRYNQKKHNIYN
jgi:hypothetical protein